MIEYMEKSTKVGGFIANRVSPIKEKIKIQLTKKDGLKSLMLTLTTIFYLPNNSLNLISLDLLNNTRIYYHNKDQILYNQNTQKIPTFAKKYKTSFLLHSHNLSLIAINLFREHKV